MISPSHPPVPIILCWHSNCQSVWRKRQIPQVSVSTRYNLLRTVCVWHLILHTSSICPGYSVTLYLCCIPCAYFSWVSAPNPVAGWSIVWCHLSCISTFLHALEEFSELCSDAKFLCIFYHSLYFGEIIFADSSISWPSERKVYECILIIHQYP